MDKRLEQIRKEFLDTIQIVTDREALEKVYTTYLGRKGILTDLLRQVKDVAVEERPRIGQVANRVKEELERVVSEIRMSLRGSPDTTGTSFDTTEPGLRHPMGHIHPITTMTYQLEDLFQQMGFVVLDGPEVESEYYNFNALNVPADHPARDMQDTFWINEHMVLRTQTSPVQIRALQQFGAPFRCIVPGRVFRSESTDASHDHTFDQMEGLMVDRGISIGHLVAVVQTLLQNVFNASVEVRLRPGFFPFVEPGFELDMRCLICKGAGCSVCKQSGWLEILPCGLVHPAVLQAGGVDPNVFTGFAFGLGLTRLVMMKYGIDDIRLLRSGDSRFIQQF